MRPKVGIFSTLFWGLFLVGAFLVRPDQEFEQNDTILFVSMYIFMFLSTHLLTKDLLGYVCIREFKDLVCILPIVSNTGALDKGTFIEFFFIPMYTFTLILFECGYFQKAQQDVDFYSKTQGRFVTSESLDQEANVYPTDFLSTSQIE